MSAPTESTPPPHAPVPPHPPVHVPPPPPGTAFALGWLMAGLFDDRRRRILDVRQPPFSQALQLPLVADLAEPDLLKFLVTDLHDLLRPYHDGSDARVSDARVQAEAAKRQPGSAEPFDKGAFDREVTALHLAILDRFADDRQQLNAYQIGLALSDLCWLPGPEGLDSVTGMFRRDQIAAMQTWLNGAGTAIPQSTGAIVGQSLGHWADWADVNAATLRAVGAGTAKATTVISAAGGGIFGGVSRALGGVGYDIWNAARREAQVWSITWLPAMAQGVSQRAKLESRGVAAPNIRKNLEG